MLKRLKQWAVGQMLAAFRTELSLLEPGGWEEILGGSRAASDIVVGHLDALRVAAFFQGISIISGDCGSLPLRVYRKVNETDREHHAQHPADFLLDVRADARSCLPAFEMRRRLIAQAVVWGNGYGFVERRNRVGRPVAIRNLDPRRTHPDTAPNGDPRYIWVTPDGREEPLRPSEVLHVQGLSLTNGVGADLVDAARDALGLSLAAEQFGSKFFANGAQLGGVITVPPNADDEYIENVAKGHQRKQAGLENAFKVLVARDGSTFLPTTSDPSKSQLTGLAERQVREVSRFLNLPPFKLGLEDSSSYGSNEAAQRVYLAGTLRHWLNALTTEATCTLLTEQELVGRQVFLEHDTDRLVESDAETRTKILTEQVRATIINPNEARQELGRNARDGGEAYGNPATSSGKAEAQLQRATQAALARAVRRVTREAERYAADGDAFVGWLDGDLQSHAEPVASMLEHLVDDPQATAAELLDRCRADLEAPTHAPESDLAENVSAVVGRLVHELPTTFATRSAAA